MLSFFEEEFPFGRVRHDSFRETRTVAIAARDRPPGSREVPNVIAALKYFELHLDDGDRPLLRCFVKARIDEIHETSVELTVEAGIRDASEHFDDAFGGFARIGLIVSDTPQIEGYANQLAIAPGIWVPLLQQEIVTRERAFDNGAVFLRGFDMSFVDTDQHIMTLGCEVDRQVVAMQPHTFDAIDCRVALANRARLVRDPGSRHRGLVHRGEVLYSVLRFPNDLVGVDTGRLWDRHELAQGGTNRHVTSGQTRSQAGLFAALKGFQLCFLTDDHPVEGFQAGVLRVDLASGTELSEVVVGGYAEIHDRAQSPHMWALDYTLIARKA
jgi:hypothetical protein